MTKNTSRQRGGNAHGGGNGNTQPKNTTRGQGIQPVYAANDRVVGEIIGGTFHKNVRGSVHMLRAPRGWAVDTDVLESLRALGVTTITVTDTESGTNYAAPVAALESFGVAFNRGYGPQVALPLGYWAINGKPPRLGEPPKQDADATRQLSLFADTGP